MKVGGDGEEGARSKKVGAVIEKKDETEGEERDDIVARARQLLGTIPL